jgi:hypothetical protein
MKPFLVLALIATPAFADVYKCNIDGKTVYQDVACANARRIDNLNGLPPTPEAMSQAQARAARESAFVDQQKQARATDEARDARSNRAHPAPKSPSPSSARPQNTSGRPDRYYDRPDRYRHRSVSRHALPGQDSTAPHSAPPAR